MYSLKLIDSDQLRSYVIQHTKKYDDSNYIEFVDLVNTQLSNLALLIDQSIDSMVGDFKYPCAEYYSSHCYIVDQLIAGNCISDHAYVGLLNWYENCRIELNIPDDFDGDRYRVNLPRLFYLAGCPLYDFVIKGNNQSSHKHPWVQHRSGYPVNSVIKFNTDVVNVELDRTKIFTDYAGVLRISPPELPPITSLGDHIPVRTNVREDNVIRINMPRLVAEYERLVSDFVALSKIGPVDEKSRYRLGYLYRLYCSVMDNVHLIGDDYYGYITEVGERSSSSDRWYNKGISTQNMKREFREVLLEEFVELDLNSAAINWSIITADKTLADCPYLSKYLHNKTQYHEDIIDEISQIVPNLPRLSTKVIKTAMIAILFGASLSYSRKNLNIAEGIMHAMSSRDFSINNKQMTEDYTLAFKESTLVINLYKELNSLRKIIGNKIKYGEQLLKNGVDSNLGFGLDRVVREIVAGKKFKKNTMLSCAYQNFETEVVDYAISLMNEDDIITIVHDAIFVKPTITHAEIVELNNQLEQKFGPGIKLACKSLIAPEPIECTIDIEMNASVTTSAVVIEEEVQQDSYRSDIVITADMPEKKRLELFAQKYPAYAAMNNLN